jgi:hypothetical protein
MGRDMTRIARGGTGAGIAAVRRVLEATGVPFNRDDQDARVDIMEMECDD